MRFRHVATSTPMNSPEDTKGNTDCLSSIERLLVLEKAVNATREMIMITDRNGRIIFVNDSFVSTTGFPREEAIGQSPKILQSGHHSRQFYARLWSVILSGGTWEGDVINRRRNGSVYPERMRITPVLDGHGRIGQFVAIKQDVSARREAESRDESARLYFEKLVDTIPLPVFAKDPFGAYTFCNAKFEELVGTPKDKIIGCTVQQFADPEHAKRHMESDELLLTYGGSQMYEVPFVASDGTTQYFRFYKSTVRGESNEIMGLVGVVDSNPQDAGSDRTDEREAARSIRSVEEVISFLNHEIQTPLAGIRTTAEVLQRAKTSAQKHMDLCRLIGDESQKLSRTVLNALQVAQIIKGSFPWNWQVVGLSELCEGVAKPFGDTIDEEQHIHFKYSMPQDPVTICGDAESLARMLNLLLENALRYTGKGSVCFSLDLVERGEELAARIEIQDSGPGIHPKILQKLDQPFSLSAGLLGGVQAEGSGLGLTLSKKIIRAHGGFWEIHSDSQSGTSIRIYLPLDQKAPVKEAN